MQKIFLVLTFLIASVILNACSNQQLFSSNSNSNSSPMIVSDNAPPTWTELQQSSLKKLEAEVATSTGDATRDGWVKLAIISKRYSKDSDQLSRQLASWHAQYPNHPGNALIPNVNSLQSLQNSNTPKHIALLLPLGGPFGSQGQAVRNGFLAAYYKSLSRTGFQQTISFYDTSREDVVSLYNRALSSGADMIVGPLEKSQVEALTRGARFSVPTLALNYTDTWGTLPTNLYQFGLSPADESQQIAEKAHQTGLSRALLIAPESAWGHRVTGTLISRWQSRGGSITDTLYFAPQTNFNQAIPALLHADVNTGRKKNQAENNTPVSAMQRRQDFDVIFLLASPEQARQIVPLLKYYYANNVPIYSSSSIYSGKPNPQKDNDLNGVIFNDIPSVIVRNQGSGRLYALGYDAYTISHELSRLIKLPNFSLYAQTGALTLTPKHQIYRRLPWAKMQNGQPVR